jgi:2-keto-4-pentenoate hydratase/2-oxohepta-3-ene-1,7-dioic acid hydratase in catechol pathway
MTTWLRTRHQGQAMLGQLGPDQRVALYRGELFDAPTATGESIPLDAVEWLPPVVPRQFLGLWNNLEQRRVAEQNPVPPFPLYFVKLAASVAAHGAPIRRPAGFEGPTKFEAELGIVIGRDCFQVDAAGAAAAIFGYTCVNDVTAPSALFETDSFAQWCRAKSFPGYGPIGPVIVTGIDPAGLRVQAWLDGECKQDYPVADMIFPPVEIVRRIASEVPLLPGDVIACGTGLGACAMQPGQEIEVRIDGVGRLLNRYLG